MCDLMMPQTKKQNMAYGRPRGCVVLDTYTSYIFVWDRWKLQMVAGLFVHLFSEKLLDKSLYL